LRKPAGLPGSALSMLVGAFLGGAGGGQDALRSVSRARRCWRGSPGTRVPVISSSRRGDMECFGRSQAGSIKRAATPQGGGHDK
jgi:hypothetical protein